MPSIEQTLKNEVLALQQRAEQQHEQNGKLAATTDALADITTLDRDQIDAVRNNLTEEAQNTKVARRPLFKIPTLNPMYVRSGLYVFCGLLGYSVYTSAKVNEQTENLAFDTRTNNTKVDFQIAAGNLRGALSQPYAEYYKANQRFPQKIDDLSSYHRVPNLLEGTPIISDYQVSADGRIKMKLTEKFGYNRWMQLKPKIIKHPLWVQVGFDCISNAERRLLNQNGNAWCDYSDHNKAPI